MERPPGAEGMAPSLPSPLPQPPPLASPPQTLLPEDHVPLELVLGAVTQAEHAHHAAQRSACASFPQVRVNGSQLTVGGKRFFAAGMVLSGGGRPQLSGYNEEQVEQTLADHAALGATVLRWNAFLKGIDFEWDEATGNITGLKRGCFGVLKAVLDGALKHGLVVQIVLATAHFLRHGWGGADNVLGGVKNSDRVARIHRMMTTEEGIKGYQEHVLQPMIETIGPHPALLGFLVVNEGYFMVQKDDKPFWSETDETMSLIELQR